jgi:hypothetical protein
MLGLLLPLAQKWRRFSPGTRNGDGLLFLIIRHVVNEQNKYQQSDYRQQASSTDMAKLLVSNGHDRA